MVDTAASEFGLAVPFPRSTRIILRTIDAWRAAVGTFVYRLARSPHHHGSRGFPFGPVFCACGGRWRVFGVEGLLGYRPPVLTYGRLPT
jgi:hypothetical protein